MTSAGVSCPKTHTVAIELDAQTSSRLIERAGRTHAPLTLTFSQCGADRVADLRIQSTDAQALCLEADKGAVDDVLPSTCLEVQFALDGQEYFFSSSTLEYTESRIAIGRPERLYVWQRRRFLRASVAESAVVVLADAKGRVKGEGAMLNVSQDGLACRISRDTADRIEIDEIIGVKFELGQQRTYVECYGKLKSKIAAGSANAIIAGIHFEDCADSQDAKAQLNRLLNA